MEALLGSITALTQERDKLRAQAHVSEGVSYTLKAEISKRKYSPKNPRHKINHVMNTH